MEDYSKEDYSKEDYSKEDYSKEDYSKEDYSKEDYSKEDYSEVAKRYSPASTIGQPVCWQRTCQRLSEEQVG